MVKVLDADLPGSGVPLVKKKSKVELRRVTFVSFGRDIKPSVPGDLV